MTADERRTVALLAAETAELPSDATEALEQWDGEFLELSQLRDDRFLLTAGARKVILDRDAAVRFGVLLDAGEVEFEQDLPTARHQRE